MMTKIGFLDRLLLNAGQKYCRMLRGEHSEILLTFVKLQFAIKTFVLSIINWPITTGFTVYHKCSVCCSYARKLPDSLYNPSTHLKAGHYWPASETPFKWRLASVPMVALHYRLARMFQRKK